MTDVKLACRCGAFQGIVHGVAPGKVNRCICYCEDCQAFARYLDGEQTILNQNGGTEITQVSAGSLVISQGQDHLVAIRLSPSGPWRWYTSCCKTPVANTVEGSRLPFAGMIWPIFADVSQENVENLLGPIRGSVHGKHAYGDVGSLDLDHGMPKGRLIRLMALMLTWKLQGAARNSPLLNLDGVQPEMLGKAELQALKSRGQASNSSQTSATYVFDARMEGLTVKKLGPH